jgi:HEAT repeat protein
MGPLPRVPRWRAFLAPTPTTGVDGGINVHGLRATQLLMGDVFAATGRAGTDGRSKAIRGAVSNHVLYQGKPADYWLQMLKDRDPGYREKAIVALGAIGADDERVIPALVESFKDKNPGVQNAAAQALSSTGKEAVPRLLESLKGKNSLLRKWAAVSLSSIGPEAKDAVPALIECLEDEDRNLRSWAASALGHMAPESKAAIPALIKSFEKEDFGATRGQTGSSVDALSRFGPMAVPALNEALKDPNVKIRASAAGTLAMIGTPAKEATSNLIAALKDKDEWVRQNAGMALVRIGAAAVPALAEALKDKVPAVRVAAVQLLGQMGPEEASSAASALVKAMGDEDKGVREAAAQAYKNLPARADP